MDRVHRLGQVNPVLVFRLVTANTIEAKMLERAGAKRKLEALVIGSGKYTTSVDDLQDIFSGNTSKSNTASSSHGSGDKSAGGLAAQMFEEEMRDQAKRSEEGKDIRVIKEGEEAISEEQLQSLLDRSDEAMMRGRGWKVNDNEKAIEVIETTAADGNGDVRTMLDNEFGFVVNLDECRALRISLKEKRVRRLHQSFDVETKASLMTPLCFRLKYFKFTGISLYKIRFPIILILHETVVSRPLACHFPQP